MKITRKGLKEIIAREILQHNSVLLEMPMASTTGTTMGAHDPARDDDMADSADDTRTIQKLYLMARKLDQLHDMLKKDEGLDPKVKSEIENISERITTLLDDIMYDKDNPVGY